MEVVAATFRRTSESRQVHSLTGPGHSAGPLSYVPIDVTDPVPVTRSPYTVGYVRGCQVGACGHLRQEGNQ
jgi:hypothetical protein